MKFGDVPVREAEGCILAHSMMVAGRKWPKGRRLSRTDLEALEAEGVAAVIAVRLEPGDLGEDEAAARIAAVAGPGVEARTPTTGRVNLHAAHDGLLVLDRRAIDRMNRISEAVTLATLPPFEPVTAGQMVATVKIIPFAVPEAVVDRCAAAASAVLRVAPWRPFRAALVQTSVAGTKPSVLDKTARITAERVAAYGGTLVGERRCPHDAEAVAGAMRDFQDCDMLLLIGASAITDRADVLPRAVERSGGVVEHFGMPVDPGNLLMLGRWGDRHVLGLPGCARSPKLNGADWVLQRLAAGLPVTGEDIMGMGVGGLITDVPERPLPRAKVGS